MEENFQPYGNLCLSPLYITKLQRCHYCLACCRSKNPERRLFEASREGTITTRMMRAGRRSVFCIKSDGNTRRMKWLRQIVIIIAALVLLEDMVSAKLPILRSLPQRVTDSTSGMSQLFLLHLNKHTLRARRNKAACTPEDYTKPGVQEAVFKMIVGSKNSDMVPIIRHMSKTEKLGIDSSGSCSEIDDSNPGGGGMKLGFDISPDMPLEMRAICSFNYEENIDEKRIPRSIREVKCLCKIPQQTEGIRCEPIYNEVPVLLFDETCTNFREELQPIAFACVPVLTSQSQSTYSVSIGSSRKNDNVQI